MMRAALMVHRLHRPAQRWWAAMAVQQPDGDQHAANILVLASHMHLSLPVPARAD